MLLSWKISINRKVEITLENKEEVKNENIEEEVVENSEESSQDEEEVIDLIDPKDEEITKLQEEVSRLKNAYAKVFADTENLKKRLNAEAEQIKKYRIQSFASEILPVIDNLERALASDENKKDEGFYKGVDMIYRQLIDALKKEGVVEIECLGKPFDPNVAQSIMMEKSEGVESNVVIEVFQKGYLLKDRVLRAAMVKISE